MLICANCFGSRGKRDIVEVGLLSWRAIRLRHFFVCLFRLKLSDNQLPAFFRTLVSLVSPKIAKIASDARVLLVE